MLTKHGWKRFLHNFVSCAQEDLVYCHYGGHCLLAAGNNGLGAADIKSVTISSKQFSILINLLGFFFSVKICEPMSQAV